MAKEVPDFEVRQMKREEIPDVHDLWIEFGYPGASVEPWFEYDPEGFYVAVTKDGTVLGVCAGVLQNEDLAFVGIYIVKKNMRGRGIGRKIWNKVMERIGDRNAGVNSVMDQVENYKTRGGFPIQSDWTWSVCVAEEVRTSEIISELPGVDVCQISSQDQETINAVVKYDADILGFAREAIVSMLWKEIDTVTVIAKDSNSKSVCGYGAIKIDLDEDTVIGPLYADDSSIAELIIYHLVKSFSKGEKNCVLLKTVDRNQEVLQMSEKLGFKRMYTAARLYSKAEVEIQFDKVFGVYNLNFVVF